MKPTEVVVAVITYESATLFPDCLDSIPAAMAGVHSYRVVVADNASPDDSVEVAKTAGARLGVEVLELGESGLLRRHKRHRPLRRAGGRPPGHQP